jgi:hypothetical protein
VTDRCVSNKDFVADYPYTAPPRRDDVDVWVHDNVQAVAIELPERTARQAGRLHHQVARTAQNVGSSLREAGQLRPKDRRYQQQLEFLEEAWPNRTWAPDRWFPNQSRDGMVAFKVASDMAQITKLQRELWPNAALNDMWREAVCISQTRCLSNPMLSGLCQPYGQEQG